MKKILTKKKVPKKTSKDDRKIWLGFYSTFEKFTPAPPLPFILFFFGDRGGRGEVKINVRNYGNSLPSVAFINLQMEKEIAKPFVEL